MAGGKITRIAGGTFTQRCKNLTYYQDNFTINAGGKISLTTDGEMTFGIPDKAPSFRNIESAIVEFRPMRAYKGEFGFDWMKTGRTSDRGSNYTKILETGYKNINENLSKEDAYKLLDLEYETIQIKRKDGKEEDYPVPYMTLFSKEFVDGLDKEKYPVLPSYEAKLDVYVEIELCGDFHEDMDQIDEIKFEYDTKLFAIDKLVLLEKTTYSTKEENKMTQSRISPITISCLKDFSTPQYIDIYAYSVEARTEAEKQRRLPTEAEKNKHRKLAGTLKVLPNCKNNRRKVDIAFVSVKDIRNGIITQGTFFDKEKIKLYQSLYQALIVPNMVDRNDKGDNLTLDLSTHKYFVKGGKCINERDELKVEIKNEKKDINHETFNAVRNAFFRIYPQYQDYLTVFSFNIKTNMDVDVLGLAQDIGLLNAFVFPNRNIATLVHELYHALGLQHSFHDTQANVLSNSKYKYVFSKHSTGNMLDTPDHNGDKRNMTFYWQWKILNQNIK